MRRLTLCAWMIPSLVMFWLTSSASAAFPGRDGLLAVQPQTGSGILLVSPGGRIERRICGHRSCGSCRPTTTCRATGPRWSPDGRALVVGGPAQAILYADGSCLNCELSTGRHPAFESGDTVISSVVDGTLGREKIDGVGVPGPPSRAASDAVWSTRGRLAVVSAGAIWAGSPTLLKRMAAGSQPSWSPDGQRIAAAQRGWIVILTPGSHHTLRLVRGSAPAFSPDGRLIAFVGPDHRLMIVRIGRRLAPRAVGRIQAAAVDWQPVQRGSTPVCPPLPGARVIASSRAARVTADPSPGPAGTLPPPDYNAPVLSYMGCLRGDGRWRLLESFNNPVDERTLEAVDSAAVAAPYAALVQVILGHAFDSHRTVQVFDLRTGTLRPRLGGEPGGSQVVVGHDGVSATYDQTVDPMGSLSILLNAVSCAPASSTCAALPSPGPSPSVFGSTDPSGGAGSWTPTSSAAFPQPFVGPVVVDCLSATRCLGANQTDIFSTTTPAAGASAWTPSPLPGTQPVTALPTEMTCPTTDLCLITRTDGSLASSADPTGGGMSWSTFQLDAGRSLHAVFCSPRPLCFVTDTTVNAADASGTPSSGTVFTSTDPTGGASAWSVSGDTPLFTAGRCPTTTFCVALRAIDRGPFGSSITKVQTTTDPGTGGWMQQPDLPDLLNGISCPSVSLCVAVGDAGALDVSTAPASGVWTRTTIDLGRRLTSIDCPSVSLCVATDATGHVVTSRDAAGGAAAWTPALIAGEPCADTTPCSLERIVASDASGIHTVASSNQAGTGPFLGELALDGDVLSWTDDGTGHSVALRP